MKTIYEVTRPLVEKIALDGKIDVPISYAYSLYREEMMQMLDPEAILAAWVKFTNMAARDKFVRTFMWHLIQRAYESNQAVSKTFWTHYNKSNLTQVQERQAESLQNLSNGMFENLLTLGLLSDDKNDHIMDFSTMVSSVVGLIIGLDDVVDTFDDLDVSIFQTWLSYVLIILNWPTELAKELS